MEQSSEQELQKNDGAEGAERGAEWEVTERGAGLNYRNRLKRRAAFLPPTLRSHVLVHGRSTRWTVQSDLVRCDPMRSDVVCCGPMR